MMTKKSMALLALVLLLGASLVYYAKKNVLSKEAEEVSQASLSEGNDSPALDSSLQGMNEEDSLPSHMAGESGMDGRGLSNESGSAPSQAPAPGEHLIEEAKKDQGAASESLLEFAANIAPRMEVAMNSEEDATALFGELEDCLLNNSKEMGVDASIQAVCLVNAEVLKKKFAVLESRYAALMGQVDPDVIRLAAE